MSVKGANGTNGGSGERKTILVAGGSGMIGRALVSELVDEGYELVVLSREPREVDGLPRGARAVGWDGESADGWDGEADGAFAIVNLAGANLASGRWTDERKRVLRQSRLQSTAAVVEAIDRAEAKPRVLVQGSAVGYYGGDAAGTDSPPLSEAAPQGDDFLARLAADWEAASEPVEEMGVRRAISRTGVVLAENEGALPMMALPFRMFVGGPVGRGDQWVSWIHLRDQVRALRFLIESPSARGPFNLSAPEPVTNEGLSEILAAVLRRPSFLRAPAFALRTALGEMADVLLEGQRVVPTKLESQGFEFLFPRLRPALEDLLGRG